MLSRIMCLIIVILEARCLFLSIGDRRWKVFAFYTQLSNITKTVSAILLPRFGKASRFLLQAAYATTGEKILYDIHPIKKWRGQVVLTRRPLIIV